MTIKTLKAALKALKPLKTDYNLPLYVSGVGIDTLSISAYSGVVCTLYGVNFGVNSVNGVAVYYGDLNSAINAFSAKSKITVSINANGVTFTGSCGVTTLAASTRDGDLTTPYKKQESEATAFIQLAPEFLADLQAAAALSSDDDLKPAMRAINLQIAADHVVSVFSTNAHAAVWQDRFFGTNPAALTPAQSKEADWFPLQYETLQRVFAAASAFATLKINPKPLITRGLESVQNPNEDMFNAFAALFGKAQDGLTIEINTANKTEGKVPAIHSIYESVTNPLRVKLHDTTVHLEPTQVTQYINALDGLIKAVKPSRLTPNVEFWFCGQTNVCTAMPLAAQEFNNAFRCELPFVATFPKDLLRSEIGFNAVYLRDILKNYVKHGVSFTFSNDNTAVLFTGGHRDCPECLIMPVQLRA